MNGATQIIAIMLVTFSLAGCHKEKPLLAGGKSVAHWIERSCDPSDKVRKEAVAKLGNVGHADPAVLPSLIAALKDKSPAVRREAIVGIVKYGPEANDVRESLMVVQTNDPDPAVRDFAARAMQKLDQAAGR
jgi:HEAT repeats